jgi:RNA polymerase sigma factor (sigma-70 family)
MILRRVEARSGEAGAVYSSDASAESRERRQRVEALADFAREQQGALVRFLARRTGSIEEAREIAQEAYLKVLAVRRTDAIASLTGYLWRSALNLATDRMRRRQVRERFIRTIRPQFELHSPSAETVASARERLDLVEQAIAQLPPRCLDAFILRIVQARRFEDVGRAMGISSRMAKIYVARALTTLHARLQQGDRGDSRSRSVLRHASDGTPVDARVAQPQVIE